MPKFNRSIKMQDFHGHRIPQSARKAALGSEHGVYFFWKGEWNFTVIDRHYISLESGPFMDSSFDVDDSRGDNPIEILK